MADIKSDSFALFWRAYRRAEHRIVNDPPEGAPIVAATEWVMESEVGSVYVKVIKRGEDAGKLL